MGARNMTDKTPLANQPSGVVITHILTTTTTTIIKMENDDFSKNF